MAKGMASAAQVAWADIKTCKQRPPRRYTFEASRSKGVCRRVKSSERKGPAALRSRFSVSCSLEAEAGSVISVLWVWVAKPSVGHSNAGAGPTKR